MLGLEWQICDSIVMRLPRFNLLATAWNVSKRIQKAPGLVEIALNSPQPK
jgi:hypothetical protein